MTKVLSLLFHQGSYSVSWAVKHSRTRVLYITAQYVPRRVKRIEIYRDKTHMDVHLRDPKLGDSSAHRVDLLYSILLRDCSNQSQSLAGTGPLLVGDRIVGLVSQLSSCSYILTIIPSSISYLSSRLAAPVTLSLSLSPVFRIGEGTQSKHVRVKSPPSFMSWRMHLRSIYLFSLNKAKLKLVWMWIARCRTNTKQGVASTGFLKAPIELRFICMRT
ncbi:hypothetical protein KQX54_015699 [Cotesia glomerata]|uniref:Uncharacterized protein n=1 Tax=Cotesia glomerata TaxID=32391 RepID=A0AAV7HYZ2_COTGL|nr:hypothetical protein KQX54_015699 [Cotesia glomerata]